jgi:hypothetical protein
VEKAHKLTLCESPFREINYQWSHALYCFGSHTHNGQKYIIAKSSWCTTGITEHHIKQHYDFETGNTFDGWTPDSQRQDSDDLTL